LEAAIFGLPPLTCPFQAMYRVAGKAILDVGLFYTRKLISALPVAPRFAAAAVGSVVV
jgi:hypothetical protein